jgi:hypothetical protein
MSNEIKEYHISELSIDFNENNKLDDNTHYIMNYTTLSGVLYTCYISFPGDAFVCVLTDSKKIIAKCDEACSVEYTLDGAEFNEFIEKHTKEFTKFKFLKDI